MKARWTHAIWVTVPIPDDGTEAEDEIEVEILLTVEAVVYEMTMGWWSSASYDSGIKLLQWEFNCAAPGQLKSWELPEFPRDQLIEEAVETWWAKSSNQVWDSYEDVRDY